MQNYLKYICLFIYFSLLSFSANLYSNYLNRIYNNEFNKLSKTNKYFNENNLDKILINLIHRSLNSHFNHKNYIYLENISESLIKLIIFQEDQNFYNHRGYSLRDMIITIRDFLLFGHKLRGASTITQQLARTLFLKKERSIIRKIYEIKITRILEKNLNKDYILEIYLNQVFWGNGVFGIKEAANFYFNTHPKNLTIEQSYFLVSILPNPSACNSPKYCTNPGVLRRINRLKKYYEKL